MTNRPLPPAEVLRSQLAYDPESGVLIWRERPEGAPAWNARYAGRVAGGPHNAGYIRINVAGARYLAHRVIWKIVTGADPVEQIDHENGVRDDNRWCNLRAVSHTDNTRNMSQSRANTSGATGVVWDKRKGRWLARIGHRSSTKHLGYFRSLDEAIAARKAASDALGYHERHGQLAPANPSVAPATDKRPALAVSSVADDFRDLIAEKVTQNG